jgi:hypothetical protein
MALRLPSGSVDMACIPLESSGDRKSEIVDLLASLVGLRPIRSLALPFALIG